MTGVARTEVRRRLARDRERLREHFASYALPLPTRLWAHPSYVCIWLHRWSAYYFATGRRLRGRMFWHLNLLITGADIAPISDIGAGVVIVHPISTQIFGRLGADCTLWGHGGIGGGRSVDDIGAGPGLPVVGDNVTFGARAMVLGPVRVGDGCDLGPGSVVVRDLLPGSRVEMAFQNRSFRSADADTGA